MRNRGPGPSLLALVASLAAMLSAAGATAAPSPKASPNDYGRQDAWLCWPGRADACAYDNAAAAVGPDGGSVRQPWSAAKTPAIDCFYVYPTVSNDPGVISDMSAGEEERQVAQQQVSRLASQCRLFAPMYRQFTRAALRALVAKEPLPDGAAALPDTGFNDVADAWRYYLAHENHGRGVVLIGHSQGSFALTDLIAKEIDGKPTQALLVSAVLMGTSLPVEDGKDTGLFRSIPLCRSTGQVGCVVAYASFRADYPPPADSGFGRVVGGASNLRAACVNPAALAGGKALAHPYFWNRPRLGPPAETPPAWSQNITPTEPFVTLPGMIEAECRRDGAFDYLAITVHGDPADARIDDIPGDVMSAQGPVRAWGLHRIDANLMLGDLERMLAQQAESYARARSTR